MSHRDGTPVYRYEEVTGLKGQYREPSMEAEPIRAKAPWRRVEDSVAHCLDGESLLLTGFPGTGKTHLAKRIVENHGDTVHIITKTHAAVQNVGLGAQTADRWVRRNVRSGHCSATWLVIEELTQLDTPLWADIACLSMNKKIRFLLLGNFRQLPAVLDSFAGAEVCKELKDSQLARTRRCPVGAVRGPRRGADECAADHEGLAGAAIDRAPGERAMLRGAGAAEAHSALQRDYVCFGSGPDPEGAGLAVRCGEPALQHQAPLHGLLPGHQFGAFERFVRLRRIRGRLRAFDAVF